MMTTHAHIKPYSGRVRYYVQSSTNVQMRAAGPGRPRSGEKTDGWARVRLLSVSFGGADAGQSGSQQF
jgi:hypothetical protein